MLTVATLRSASTDYYLGHVRRHDEDGAVRRPGGLGALGRLDRAEGSWWVSGGNSPPGTGGGRRVGPEALGGLLAGRLPGRDRDLRGGRAVSVSGYDLCFSAPKSVSVLLGLSDERTGEVVVAAHEEAARDAFGYLQRRAAAVRREEAGERRVLPVDGLTGAAFLHGTSRTGDPHLHSHVVVPNLVHGADGRWTALDGRGFFAHARAAGGLYEAQLRSTLHEELGVEWERRRNGQLELRGIGPEVLGELSGRRADIAAHLFERGLARPSFGASRVAWAATRPDKEPVTDVEEHRRRWRHRLEVMTGDDRLRGVARPTPRAVQADEPDPLSLVDERHFAASIEPLRQGLTRREVVAAWSASATPGAAVDDVDQSVQHWVPDAALGVTERRIEPRSVVPATDAVRLLGPRSNLPRHQPVWHRAAEALDAYGRRWGLTRVAEDFQRGPASRRSGWSSRRLADQLGVQREVDSALRQMGRRPRERASLSLGRGR